MSDFLKMLEKLDGAVISRELPEGDLEHMITFDSKPDTVILSSGLIKSMNMSPEIYPLNKTKLDYWLNVQQFIEPLAYDKFYARSFGIDW